MQTIEELWIQENHVKDIKGIEGMENLRILVLRENPLTDISPLEKLEKLEVIDLQGCVLKKYRIFIENSIFETGILYCEK